MSGGAFAFTVGTAFSGQRAGLDVGIGLSGIKGKGTDEATCQPRPFEVPPLNVALKATSLGNGWQMPDLRDISLVVTHGTPLEGRFEGKTLTDLNGKIHSNIADLQGELAQLIDFGALKLKGDVTATASASGNLLPVGDSSASAAANPTTAPAAVVASAPAGEQDLRLGVAATGLSVQGLEGGKGFAQDYASIEAATKVERDAAGALKSLKGTTLVAFVGPDQKRPTLAIDINAAEQPITFKTVTTTDPKTGKSQQVTAAMVPLLVVNRFDVVDLHQAQLDFGSFVAALKDFNVYQGSLGVNVRLSFDGEKHAATFHPRVTLNEMGILRAAAAGAGPAEVLPPYSMTIAADGEYSADAATTHVGLSNLSIADKKNWLSLAKDGAADISATMAADGTTKATGGLRFGINLAAWNDVFRKAGAKPVEVAVRPAGSSPTPAPASATQELALRDGRIDGALQLTQPGPSSIGLSVDIDATKLTVASSAPAPGQAPQGGTPPGQTPLVQDEAVKIVLRAAAKSDLSSATLDRLDVTGRLVEAHGSKGVFALKTGSGKEAVATPTLEKVRSLSMTVVLPNLPQIQALLDAWSPPAATPPSAKVASALPSSTPSHDRAPDARVRNAVGGVVDAGMPTPAQDASAPLRTVADTLIEGTYERVDKNNVPPVVRTTLHGVVSTPKDLRYYRLQSGGATIYVGQYVPSPGHLSEIRLSADGKVLQGPKETEVDLSNPPAPAVTPPKPVEALPAPNPPGVLTPAAVPGVTSPAPGNSMVGAAPAAPAPAGTPAAVPTPAALPIPPPTPTPGAPAAAEAAPAPPKKLTGGSLTLNLNIANDGHQTTVTPDVAIAGLSFSAGAIQHSVGNVTLKARAVITPAAAPLRPGPPPSIADQIQDLQVPEFAIQGAGSTISLKEPLIIKEPAAITAMLGPSTQPGGSTSRPATPAPAAAIPTISVVLSAIGDIEQLTDLTDALAGRAAAPTYRGTYQITQKVATTGNLIAGDGTGQVQNFVSLSPTDHKTVAASEQMIHLSNTISFDTAKDGGTLTIGKLEFGLDTSKAAAGNITGVIHDLSGKRVIDSLKGKITNDLAKLWPILHPFLAPKPNPAAPAGTPLPVDEYANLKIDGTQPIEFELSGTYASGVPFGEAVAGISGDGSMGVKLLDTSGLRFENLQLPFVIDKGHLRVVYAGKPEGQNLPPPADCNGGKVSIGGTAIDLTQPVNLMTILKNTVVLDKVALSPILANRFNGFIPIFDDSVGGGPITFKVVQCDRLPLGKFDQVAEKDAGGADFELTLGDVQLGGGILGQLNSVAGKFGGSGTNNLISANLGGVGDVIGSLRGDVKAAKIGIKGRTLSLQDFTLLVGKNQIKLLSLSGTVGLEDDGQLNLKLTIPPKLLARFGKEAEQYLPAAIELPITGSKLHPQIRADSLIQKLVTDSAQKALLDRALGGGRKSKNGPSTGPSDGSQKPNVGDILGDVLGGKKRDKAGNNPEGK